MVFDCRPQVLPGAMDISGTELTEIRSMTRARVATTAPPEREQSFGGGGGFAGFDLPGVGCSWLTQEQTVRMNCRPRLTRRWLLIRKWIANVVSLPTMVTPVSDIDRAFCAPEKQGPVIAPPAVSTVVIRPSTATTTAGRNFCHRYCLLHPRHQLKFRQRPECLRWSPYRRTSCCLMQ